MIDQADELRRMVAGGAGEAAGSADVPRTLVLAGGRPGVGVTTLAAHLALTLAADAQRVVLADCDLHRADLAGRCDAAETSTIADVLAGKRNIHETLQRGPAGIQLLAGSRSAELRLALNERAIRRFCQQFRTLGKHADWIIFDAGSESNELTSRLAALAERLLIVTSPDAVAVMDTYALVKTLLSRQRLVRPIDLVVTSADQNMASDVHRRIDQSCRRFLGLAISLAGWIPHVPAISTTVNLAELDRPGLGESISRLLQPLSGPPGATARARRAA